MSCERFHDAITDHACGGTVPGAAAAHLSGCATCRLLLQDERRRLAAADGQLRDALRIAPSADFVSRTTARAITTRARPRFAGAAAAWAAVAAAVMLAAAAYVALRVTDDTAPPRVAPGRHDLASAARTGPSRDAAAIVPAAPAEGTTAPDPVGRRASAKRERASRAVIRQARAAEVEVLVPPAQARALERLRDLLRTGALDGSSLPAPAEATPIDALVIPPLVVEDIVVPDVHSAGGPAPAQMASDREGF